MALTLIGVWKKDAYSTEFILCAAMLFLFSLTPSLNSNRKMVKFQRIMSVLAKNTFSVYLIHYSIMEFFMRVFPQMGGIKRFWITIGISELVGIIFYKMFESKGKTVSNKLIAVYKKKN